MRFPFLLRCSESRSLTEVLLPEKTGFRYFTVWQMEDYVFGYFEGEEQDGERMLSLLEKLPESVELLYRPGEMRLMYENLGWVNPDKAALSYRVFSARLKPDCAEEYKRRHDGIKQFPTDQPRYESNWGIWLGDGCIFGYCERDPELRREPTEEQRNANVQWETRQLEIMDWITDDMDWLTGEKHVAVERIL